MNSIIAAAAAEAQPLFAQLGGMAPTAAGNFSYLGRTGTGNFSAEQVVEELLPAGGSRRQSQVTLMVLRSALPAPPERSKTIARIDLSPQPIYRIESVADDPLYYTLRLLRIS